MQLVINITTADGELLEQITITECTADKHAFARDVVEHIERKFDTVEPPAERE